jgi:hypothetical protein
MTMKVVLALVFLGIQSVCAAANCTLDDLTDTPADGPLCLFYMGTSAYRDQDFAQAARHWQALIALKSVPAEQAHLKLDVYNNLGYLYYLGMGVKTNKVAAFDYWKYAYKAGHDEAAYHLCHAYADRKRAEFNPRVAREYCTEALRRYAAHEQRDRGDDTIVRQLRQHLRAVSP